MASMQWTDEESRYLQAIFSWRDCLEQERNSGPRPRAEPKASAGEFRILLIGAKGVGKTALLRRFCDGRFLESPGGTGSTFEHGGRQTIEVDGQPYTMDVLELPAQHWDMGEHDNKGSRKPQPAAMMLDQALAITEAAIVLYDVCDRGSFQQAKSLYERLKKHKQQLAEGASQHEQEQTRGQHKPSRSRKPKQKHAHAEGPGTKRRPSVLLLVGNKRDVEGKAGLVSGENGDHGAASVPAVTTRTRTHSVVGKWPASAVQSDVFLEVSAKTGDKVDDVFVRIGRDILKQREQLQTEEEDRLAARGHSSGSDTMGRVRSRASSTRRRFGGFRLGFPFVRRAVAAGMS